MDPDDEDVSLAWVSRWDLVPLTMAAALFLALPSLMKGLPDPIPTHFDALGRPNGWTSKATYPWLAFGLPFFIWALMLLLGRAFAGTDQDPDGLKFMAQAPLRGLATTGVLLLMGSLPLIPQLGSGLLGWVAALFLGLVILGIVLMVGQLNSGGSLDG